MSDSVVDRGDPLFGNALIEPGVAVVVDSGLVQQKADVEREDVADLEGGFLGGESGLLGSGERVAPEILDHGGAALDCGSEGPGGVAVGAEFRAVEVEVLIVEGVDEFMDDRGLGRQREFAVRADEQTVRGGEVHAEHTTGHEDLVHVEHVVVRAEEADRTGERETRRRPLGISGQLGLEIVEHDAGHRVDVDQFDIRAFEEVTPAGLLDEHNRFVDKGVELGLLISGGLRCCCLDRIDGFIDAEARRGRGCGQISERVVIEQADDRLHGERKHDRRGDEENTAQEPERETADLCVRGGGFCVGLRSFTHRKPASWATRRAASTTAGPNTDPGSRVSRSMGPLTDTAATTVPWRSCTGALTEATPASRSSTVATHAPPSVPSRTRPPDP